MRNSLGSVLLRPSIPDGLRLQVPPTTGDVVLSSVCNIVIVEFHKAQVWLSRVWVDEHWPGLHAAHTGRRFVQLGWRAHKHVSYRRCSIPAALPIIGTT